MRHRTLTSLLILLMATAAVPGALAQEAEPDNEQVSHSYETDVSAEEATVDIRRETPGVTDKIEIKFATTDATASVEFESLRGRTEAEQSLEAQLHQLAEYVDENDNDRYDPGEEIVGWYGLSSEAEALVEGPREGRAHWDDLVAQEVESDEGLNGTHIMAVGHLMPAQAEPVGDDVRVPIDGQPQVQVDIYVWGASASFNGVNLRPTEVKIDLTYRNYTFQQEDTKLALLLETESEAERTVPAHDRAQRGGPNAASDEADEGEQDRMPADASGVQAPVAQGALMLSFTWAPEAEVDGEMQPVHATILEADTESETEEDEEGTETESETETAFALSYARGQEIIHDPKAGAVYDAQASEESAEGANGSLDAPFPALPLVALALGLVALRRRQD